MTQTPRQRFLDYVRGAPGARAIVSPFLPSADVVAQTLSYLGLAATDDSVANEVALARALDYEPMFMTDCHGLIFAWDEDPSRSDDETVFRTIQTRLGEWTRRVSRELGEFGDDSGFPVRTAADHDMLVATCRQVGERERVIRQYFREWRRKVGDDGVIVIGHPHVTWLGYQIGQQNMTFHYVDHREAYCRSMDAICEAAEFVFGIAMDEGIDFMSESSGGLDMTSPALFDEQDLPYLRALSGWTHDRGGLFWYHNCGMTRGLILSGRLNRFACDVFETVSPPPEGDNDLAEARRYLDPSITSKGNLSLGLLRDGTPDRVAEATVRMVEAARGYRHIFSTADAVLPGTPPENLVAFVQSARSAAL